MSDLSSPLSMLYLKLIGGVLLGWSLGRILPPSVPTRLGRFLFWIGVPLSIVAFLRKADLSGAVWLAPAIAWVAIGLGAVLARLWMKMKARSRPLDPLVRERPFQGSFLLTAMLGNTGYLGYPVVLSLVGEKYFAWALFYDLLGSLFGAYGLGAVVAARLGRRAELSASWFRPLIENPALWSFFFGLGFREVSLPSLAERIFHSIAWGTVALALVLMGMRLSQIRSWQNWQPASVSLAIKMLLVPFAIGIFLPLFGVRGSPQLVLVLQMAMPPAFATLILAEAYDLDCELTVTSLFLGSTGLLLTLPLWVALFQ
ncbi:MAG: AEC family transporter [Cyanobacteriota bacterium]|nr:AEC family transporter [Cyanobacteriota bacterium]